MWKSDREKHLWRPWFKFVSDFLLFRPQTETMASKHLVAVIWNWEGKSNKSIPCVVELYFGFYISWFCKELHAPAIVIDTPSSSKIPSPLSSPGKSKELLEENYILDCSGRDIKINCKKKHSRWSWGVSHWLPTSPLMYKALVEVSSSYEGENDPIGGARGAPKHYWHILWGIERLSIEIKARDHWEVTTKREVVVTRDGVSPTLKGHG